MTEIIQFIILLELIFIDISLMNIFYKIKKLEKEVKNNVSKIQS